MLPARCWSLPEIVVWSLLRSQLDGEMWSRDDYPELDVLGVRRPSQDNLEKGFIDGT